MKPVVLLQARYASRRFPGKTLNQIHGKPLLAYLLDRLLFCGMPVVLLVPLKEYSLFVGLIEKYSALCKELHRQQEKQQHKEDGLSKKRKIRSLAPFFKLFGGDGTDVLLRFVQALNFLESKGLIADTVFRVTGDNPFTSLSHLVSLARVIKNNFRDNHRLPALAYTKGLPYGSGVEALSAAALFFSDKHAKLPYDREHVSSYLHRNIAQQQPTLSCCGKQGRESETKAFEEGLAYFSRAAAEVVVEALKSHVRPQLRLTVDTPKDMQLFAMRVKDYQASFRYPKCAAELFTHDICSNFPDMGKVLPLKVLLNDKKK